MRCSRTVWVALVVVILAGAFWRSFAETATLRLESSDRQLARLTRALNLTETQKQKIKRVIEKADLDIRLLVKSRDEQIRNLLSKDQGAMFDEIQTELSSDEATTAAPAADRARRQGGPWQGEGMGEEGPPRGGPQSGFSPRGRRGGGINFKLCGDGVCQPHERDSGMCPADCRRAD